MNVTLNEDLVAHARAVTDNLSAPVEALLADYVADDQRRRAVVRYQVLRAARVTPAALLRQD